jgi:hypothetical protein
VPSIGISRKITAMLRDYEKQTPISHFKAQWLLFEAPA